jgi:hypothetical protein
MINEKLLTKLLTKAFEKYSPKNIGGVSTHANRLIKKNYVGIMFLNGGIFSISTDDVHKSYTSHTNGVFFIVKDELAKHRSEEIKNLLK